MTVEKLEINKERKIHTHTHTQMEIDRRTRETNMTKDVTYRKLNKWDRVGVSNVDKH